MRVHVKPKTKSAVPLPFWACMALCVIAGALFMFALAPFGIWGVAILSVLILYASLLMQTKGSRAFWLGFAYGFGTWFTGAFWLYNSIHEYGYLSPAISIVLIVIMAAIMALFHAMSAYVFVRYLGKQPLAFASIWVLQEWLKTWLFTGFPWLFVGYAYADVAPIAAIAPIGGVFLISFLSVLFSASLVDVLRARIGYFLLSFVLSLLSFSVYIINPEWTVPTNQTLSVSLIQGNIDQDIKWVDGYEDTSLERYALLSQNEWGQDLVVWPEGAVPQFYDEVWPFLSQIDAIAKSTNTAFITGIPYKKTPESAHETPLYYNSAALLGHTHGLYKKQRLVPFGEYIPLAGILDILPNLANSGLSYSKGDKNQPLLDIKQSNAAMAICYEVAYPQTVRQNAKNSQFMLTISNDTWFGTSHGPHQHLQMVQMRSLETGRYFVRTTNNGITAIIDHKGRILSRIPQFEAGVLRGQVALRTGDTPFMKFGHMPILIIVFLLLLLSAIARLRNNALAPDYRFYESVR